MHVMTRAALAYSGTCIQLGLFVRMQTLACFEPRLSPSQDSYSTVHKVSNTFPPTSTTLK